MARFELPRGTRDFLPAEMVVRNHVESVLHHTVAQYGFQQIQTPIFEQYDLLAARSGEEIRESLFTFASDAGRYALRPEMTSPVCRLLSSDGLHELTPPYKLYYFGPCFRYCRPQAGRYREFYQAGVELMGSSDPLADAEVIAMAVKVLKELKIPDCQLVIGDVGVFRHLLEEDGLSQNQQQERQNRVLSDIDKLMHIREKCGPRQTKDPLSDDDRAFLETAGRTIRRLQDEIGAEEKLTTVSISDGGDDSAFRELAKKLPDAAEKTVRDAWVFHRMLSEEKANLLMEIYHIRGSLDHVLTQARERLKGSTALKPLEDLARVCEWLPKLGVEDYEVVLGTARNLDFYTGVVFEIFSPLVGTKRQLCGGGRYDRLVEEFGGSSLPATGFAFGFDRLVEAFSISQHPLSTSPVDVVVISPGDKKAEAVQVAEKLRQSGARVGVPFQEIESKSQLAYGDSLHSRFALEVGTESLSAERCKLYDRRASTEQELTITEACCNIQNALKKG